MTAGIEKRTETRNGKAGIVNQHTHHGVQSPADGQYDGDEIQRHGERHIELDSGHHPLGQGDQMGHCLHLIFSDVFQLILWHTVCPHLTDMQLFGNGFCGVFMVAGEENRLYAQTGKSFDGCRALLSKGVGEGEKAGKYTVYRHIRHGAALTDIIFSVLRGGGFDTVLLQQFGIAGQNGFALDPCAGAAARDLKVRRFRQDGTGLLIAAYNGLSEGVFGKLLGGSGQMVDLVCTEII